MKKIDLTKKNKICIICILGSILICSLGLFISNMIYESKLKNPETVAKETLKIFYEDKYNKKMAKFILNKDSDKYFEEIEKDLYSRVYNSIKVLGDEELIEGQDAVKVAKDYSHKNIELLKTIDNYSIENSINNNDSYIYTIKVYPKDLSNVYTEKNDCILNESIAYPEANYQTIINYYCTNKSLTNDLKNQENPITINITLNKDKKGFFRPTEDSLKTLLSVVS